MKLIWLVTVLLSSLLLPAALAGAQDYVSPYSDGSAGATSSTPLNANTAPTGTTTPTAPTQAPIPASTPEAAEAASAPVPTTPTAAETVVTIPGSNTTLTVDQFLLASCPALVKPGVLYPFAQEPAYRWQRAFLADLNKAYAAGARIARKGGLGATAKKLYQKNLTLVANRERVVQELRAQYQKNLLDCMNRQSDLRYEQELLTLTTTREQTATTTSQTITNLDTSYTEDLAALKAERKAAIAKLYGVQRSEVEQVFALKKLPGGKRLAAKKARRVLVQNKRRVNARYQKAVAQLKSQLEANKIAQEGIKQEAIRSYEAAATELKLTQEMAKISNNSEATTLPEKHYMNLSTSIGESERGEVEDIFYQTEEMIQKLSLRKLKDSSQTHDPKGGIPEVDWSQVATAGTFDNGQPAPKLNRKTYDATALVTETEAEIKANRAALKKTKGAKAKAAQAKAQAKGYRGQISSLSSQVSSGPGINPGDSASERAAKQQKHQAQKALLSRVKKEYKDLMKDYAVYEKAARRDAKIYRSEKKKFDNYNNKFDYDTRAVAAYENMNEAERRSARSSGYFKKTARKAAIAQHVMITHLENKGSQCKPGSQCYALKTAQRRNPQAGLGHGIRAVAKAKKAGKKKKQT